MTIEPAVPGAPRVPCAFVLDVTPLRALDDAMRALRSALHTDAAARDAVEISVTIAGGAAETVQPFTSPGRWHLPSLRALDGPDGAVARETSPLGDALEAAMNEIAQRTALYRDTATLHRRPWLIALVDRAPASGWERAARRLQAEAADGRFRFLAVARDASSVDVLARIAPSEAHVRVLRDGGLAAFFDWLGVALCRLATAPAGREVAPPDADTWALPADAGRRTSVR